MTCSKPGYVEVSSMIGATFQKMMLGNAVFGGVISPAIDAGSGAMNEYPETVGQDLQPEELPPLVPAVWTSLPAAQPLAADSMRNTAPAAANAPFLLN